MRSVTFDVVVEAEDREFVEQQLDELLDSLYTRAAGSEERFSEMLAHFVAMTVAPCLAATNMVLRLPRITPQNFEEQVRISIGGEPNYVNDLREFETELAESVTNAVLQTLLGPSPRIPVVETLECPDEIFLN